MKRFLPLLAVCVMISALYPQPKWERSKSPVRTDLELFHATITANFPTTETLGKGDFQYEISHRFLPAIKEGYRAFWGIDGPARIRTALSYGLSDRLMVSLGHTNLLDNVDLRLKGKVLQIRNRRLPGVIALQAGVALNTEIPGSLNRGTFDGDNFQYYIQLIYNTMLFNKRLGVGIVPSYLYNSSSFTIERQYTFSIGNYYQLYLNRMWSFWVELNPIVSGWQGFISPEELGTRSHNHIALGMDIETGGHFFHLFVTNNSRLNPSHFLVGADKKAALDNMRIGFGITRDF